LRMSLRVSQPLWSTSDHAGPNWSRSYPVFGARPFTGSASSTATAPRPPGVVDVELGGRDVDAVVIDVEVADRLVEVLRTERSSCRPFELALHAASSTIASTTTATAATAGRRR
jgi:hypothetical protein